MHEMRPWFFLSHTLSLQTWGNEPAWLVCMSAVLERTRRHHVRQDCATVVLGLVIVVQLPAPVIIV